MASAGEIITFHVLFLDGLNARMEVDSATIEIFTFDHEGERYDLVEEGTEMTAVEDDLGRYAYQYVIPADYNLGSRIYALMQAVDPASGITIWVEDVADVYEAGAGPGGAGSGGGGMTARFVK